MADPLAPDLSTLDEMTEQNILHRLKSRYARDLIYTYQDCVRENAQVNAHKRTSIKDILIAINPCKQLNLYTAEVHDVYDKDKSTPTEQPHVFQVAARAYKRLCDSETNQVIIVSGESGAGKTESTKHMVTHLVHMCQKGHMYLDQKIVEVNPLLELFGNAKTSMNPNSSRFAKFLELTFYEEGQDLAGAVVRDYMLEKSRVVHQSKGEGNFHIFYALFAGCPRDKMEDLFLVQPATYYRILQGDRSSLNDKRKYRAMYDENMDILKRIGVDTEMLHVMLAAIINISEIMFEEGNQGKADILNPAPFEHAAILLELDREDFGISLTTSKRNIGGQDIVSYKTVGQACESRDSLAKMLYERIFGWLVRQINQDLHPNRRSSDKETLGTIGILDIAGFEKLKYNSLEQLCINLVNEKLQNFMNQRIFQIEMMIYQHEGIDIEGVQFENNEKTLALFEESKGGILALLDETSKFRQGNDNAFVMELKKKFKSNPLFKEVKSDAPEFFIQHFAAKVCYNATGFIGKNRDVLNPELTECLKQSKDNLISDLFTVKRGPTGTISVPQNNFRNTNRSGPSLRSVGQVGVKKPSAGLSLNEQLMKSLKTRFDTISPAEEGMTTTQVKYVEQHKTLVSYFRASLLDLIDKLNSAEPFYVRCLKPNMLLQPNAFDDAIVLNQLRYNGITQIAKIRKMGYAVRVEFGAFVKRYKAFLGTYNGAESNVNAIKKILLQLPVVFHKDFRIGKTKVFMTDEIDLFLGKFLQIRKKAQKRILLRLVPHMRRKIDAIKVRKRLEQVAARKRAREPVNQLKGNGRSTDGQTAPNFGTSLKGTQRNGGNDSARPNNGQTTTSLDTSLRGTQRNEEAREQTKTSRPAPSLGTTIGKSVRFEDPKKKEREEPKFTNIKSSSKAHWRSYTAEGSSSTNNHDANEDDWDTPPSREYKQWEDDTDETIGSPFITAREFQTELSLQDQEHTRRFAQQLSDMKEEILRDMDARFEGMNDQITSRLGQFEDQMANMKRAIDKVVRAQNA